MTSGGGSSPGGGDDVVRLGEPEPPSGPNPRRVPRWVLAVVAIAVVAAVVAVVLESQDSSSPSATETTPTAPAPPERTTGKTVASSPAGSRPAVTRTDPHLLGVTGDWEIFARGSDDVLRIELDRGRITRTTLPSLNSSGPISFVVGPDQVLVRPMDAVPGYVVRDGKRARTAPRYLARGGPVAPGPSAGQVWVLTSPENRTTSVVGPDGRRTGTTVRLPSHAWRLRSDGNGNLLVSGTGGAYVVRPGGTERVTRGEVLAAGPTRLLTVECGRHGRCARVVVDRADHSRHRVGPAGGDSTIRAGLVSPDGSQAAVFVSAADGGSTLHLIDLDTGEGHPLAIEAAQAPYNSSSLAWSPDGRWLFVAEGRLLVVDTRSGDISRFPVNLPAVTQVTIRSGR